MGRSLAVFGITRFCAIRCSVVRRVKVHEQLAGCSKRPSSEAAGEPKPEAYPQGYVEDFDEPRTKLADFFSILLLRASVFEGELRDGGFVQLAFAECDQSLVLIIGRSS